MIASGIQPGAINVKTGAPSAAPEHAAKQPRQLLPEGTLSHKKNPHNDQQTDGVARIAPPAAG